MKPAALSQRTKRLLTSVVHDVGKRVPLVHEYARRAVSAGRARSYARICAETPVEPGVAIFESYSGRGYACSPRAISEAMGEDARTSGYERIWALSRDLATALHSRGGFDVHGIDPAIDAVPVDLDRFFGLDTLEQLKRVRIVVRGSRDYYRDYARASVWVANCRIPAHLFPRQGQTFIQCWHGTPLKRLGYDMLTTANAIYSLKDWRDHYGLEGRRLTYLLAASPFAARALASAFNLLAEDKTSAVLELGYPRNDYLSDFSSEQSAATKRRLGIPEDHRVVLYAPTWRDDQHSSGTGYTYQAQLDFDRLREQLGAGYTVLFRAHYLIANAFDFERFGDFVVDASQVNDINDLYVISDVLVTDYSSVFFDYANLRRPMIFYMYDLDRYANDIRGFYLSLDELPGPIVQTQDELVSALNSAESPTLEDIARISAFAEIYAPSDDGHASERVIERAIAPLVYDGASPAVEPKEEIPE